MPERILVVDDDPGMQAALQEVLKKRGYEGDSAFSAEEALQKVARGSYDLILLDVRLPGISGIEAIPQIMSHGDQGDIIMMTAHGSQEMALEAIGKGAYDYFTKPFNLKEMDIVIKRAIERRRLKVEVERLKNTLSKENGVISRIVGTSQSMKHVKAMIQRIAPLETTVLITGESGTGKELVADLIHSLSPRASGPFIKINCASIPENLLESELCGHERGAFTGAVSLKEGKFELAHQGAILMDEIGEMPYPLQAKLLRLVEQKQFERLGGKKSISVDVRIIAATNQDLLSLIKEKQFREDLYYRLNVATIHIPPLRERKDDLPHLIEHFLREINVKLGMNVTGVSREGMEVLLSHNWPGNIRELANLLERAVILSSGRTLAGEEVRMAFQRSPQISLTPDREAAISLGETLDEIEKTLIITALRKNKGKQCDAAKSLGLNPKNLWKKIQKHHIEKVMDVEEPEDSI
ncbi:MAG: sigma-54-dependent Fis family transcriptional regulator [Syntrophobacteraceae bacterium]|nr:sigma-54-dependent Fis family transcriptional regulator [Syntrophobacteraceae bacterium]